ncbi:hypothetical protein ACFL6S_09740 [Candidatus Poribacteria bacterium]
MITTLMAFVTIIAPAVTLEIQDTQFLVDGEPTFLLGASYYGALGASEDFVDRDLQELKKLGFNWIRVWATWSAFENNISAVDSDGNAREPYLSRLKKLCGKANELGIIVDVTLSRGGRIVKSGLIPSQKVHLNAVATLTQELKQFRNIYIDLGNERNLKDGRHVPFNELSIMRDRIKELDPERLVTASQAGDISELELRDFLEIVQVDFISPHRPRDAKSPHKTAEKTQEYVSQMKEIGRVVPVHYQEPFRRSFSKWEPKAADFLVDLRNAVKGGAAGWCFHNGDSVREDGGRPRRSFDMRESEGRMFDQLDEDERQVVQQAASILSE